MIKKLLSSLLGMVVVLTWWTIRGSNRHDELVESIPAKVWDGGGGTISVAVESTVAGKFSIGFEERREGQESGRSLNAVERVGPGAHSWSVEVPRNAGGYIEFGADAPKPGDKMSWTISHDGRQIATGSDTLERPLQHNEAFFLQEYYDDYSQPGRADDDD